MNRGALFKSKCLKDANENEHLYAFLCKCKESADDKKKSIVLFDITGLRSLFVSKEWMLERTIEEVQASSILWCVFRLRDTGKYGMTLLDSYINEMCNRSEYERKVYYDKYEVLNIFEAVDFVSAKDKKDFFIKSKEKLTKIKERKSANES